MTEPTIVPYSPEHAERVVELSLAAWAPVFASFRAVLGDTLYQRVHPDWLRDQAEAVRAALRSHETWVALCGNRVDAFVNVVFDASERSAEIHMIAVDPAAQRRGLATALTEHALRQMRARGCTLAIVATGGDPGHAPARPPTRKPASPAARRSGTPRC